MTEKEYFDGLSKNRVKIGINAKVDVEVLRRGKKDTNSAPQQVIELLEEYIRLREQNVDDILQEVSEQFKEMFSLDFIKQFLEDPDKLPKKQKNLFATELKKIGYDINYRKYLNRNFLNLGIIESRNYIRISYGSFLYAGTNGISPFS